MIANNDSKYIGDTGTSVEVASGSSEEIKREYFHVTNDLEKEVDYLEDKIGDLEERLSTIISEESTKGVVSDSQPTVATCTATKLIEEQTIRLKNLKDKISHLVDNLVV